MTESTVRLTNGQHWTAQDFVDHYFQPSASGVPTPVSGPPAPVDVDRSWYTDEGPARYYHPGWLRWPGEILPGFGGELIVGSVLAITSVIPLLIVAACSRLFSLR
jgi:hypothetical protein